MGRIKVAAKVAFTAISVGVEIYNIVKTFEACEKIKDQVQDAVDKLSVEVDELRKLKTEVEELESVIVANYTTLKAQYEGAGFKAYIQEVYDVVSSSANVSQSMTAAVQEIKDFLDDFTNADYATTNRLAKSVRNGLAIVTIRFSCYTEKITIINETLNSCLGGSKTLADAYTTAISSVGDNCNDNSYLTETEIKEYVRNETRNAGAQEDCELNSVTLVTSVCIDYNNGVTTEDIATTNKITTSQVALVTEHCSKASVTDSVKTFICTDRTNVLTANETLAKYTSYVPAEVLSTYYACAKPSLSDTTKSSICSMKNSHSSLQGVKDHFNLFYESDVETEWFNCNISDADKDVICILKTNNISLSTVLTMEIYTGHWGATLVTSTYNSCAAKDSPAPENDFFSKIKDIMKHIFKRNPAAKDALVNSYKRAIEEQYSAQIKRELLALEEKHSQNKDGPVKNIGGMTALEELERGQFA